MIKYRLATTYSRQKSYDDNTKETLEFNSGDQVYLQKSPMKMVMRFGRKRKLSPRYAGTHEILLRVGEVVYELALPAELTFFHHVFHVSMQKKCLGDLSSILHVEGFGGG